MKQHKKARYLKKNEILWISGTRHKITSVKSCKLQDRPMIRVETVGLPPMLLNLNDKLYVVDPE